MSRASFTDPAEEKAEKAVKKSKKKSKSTPEETEEKEEQMALVTTISGTTSDSYATLAEADSLLADRQWFSATWSAFSDAVKEKWLQNISHFG